MYLTKEQLAKLLAIVDEIHHVFISQYLTPAVLPRAVVKKLERAGVATPKVQGVRDAYRYGLLAANLPSEDQTSPGPTFAQVQEKLRRDPMPLSAVERQAIRAAEMMAGRYISGIGERIKTDLTQRVMESDARSRAADRKAYRKTIAHGIEQRRSNRQVASDLGHKTQDWARDMERVANTELSDAMQQGTAQEAAKRGGGNARVAKVFANACCKYCRLLYSERDGTDRPHIFPLAVLEANGTNVGRKARDWLPIIGPTHPNCRCTLVNVPRGMAFNSAGLMVPVSMADA